MTKLEREKANYEAWKRRIALKDDQWKARLKPKKSVKKGDRNG